MTHPLRRYQRPMKPHIYLGPVCTIQDVSGQWPMAYYIIFPIHSFQYLDDMTHSTAADTLHLHFQLVSFNFFYLLHWSIRKSSLQTTYTQTAQLRVLFFIFFILPNARFLKQNTQTQAVLNLFRKSRLFRETVFSKPIFYGWRNDSKNKTSKFFIAN